MTTRRFIDGRVAIILGEWDEYPDTGYYYRFEGEQTEHWIRCGNARLTRVPLFCMDTIAANPLAFL